MVTKLDKINKKAEIANQAFWDEIAPVHYKSYDIEKLKKVKSLIDEINTEKGNRKCIKKIFLTRNIFFVMIRMSYIVHHL